MNITAIGIAGIIILVILLFSKMPVGLVMGFVGFTGFVWITNFNAGANMLIMDIWEGFSNYGLTVIPMFILLGQIAYHSGISKRLYDSAYIWVGNRPGGLAMASVIASALFSAISGSTNATAATMASVTIPEMKRYKYDIKLAAGTVAAAGSLGILIPPSVIFIIYGIQTEQSIGKLFAAGIIPGILLTFLFLAAVYIQVKLKPEIAPAGEKTTFKQKIKALNGIIETVVLFILIIGGMFLGYFTPTEAAGVGAFFVIVIALIRKNLSWKSFINALTDTVKINCMIMIVVVGAVIFGKFMAITTMPIQLATWVSSLALSKYIIISLIIIVYIIGGCFMDSLAMVMLTIPIFYPVVMQLGFDPIWFGVIIVLITEMGVITPPVGINVYVVHAVSPDIPLQDIFKGVMPMFVALLICNIILLLFPAITTFLPNLF